MVGSNNATPTQLPGMETHCGRLFDQHSDIGMPTMLVSGLQQIRVFAPALVNKTYALYSTGHVQKYQATSALRAAALHPYV